MAISNNSTGLRPGVCTSSTRPTAPYEGQTVYETDTDKVLVWNGTAWYPNWNLPWGVAGDTGATATTGFAANTPLKVLTLTATIYAGRKYQIQGKIAVQASSAATANALYVQGNSVARTVWYQTTAIGLNLCAIATGFTTYTATELGVTSGSAGVVIDLYWKSGATGSLNTNPDGYISAGSASQQLAVIDIGPA